MLVLGPVDEIVSTDWLFKCLPMIESPFAWTWFEARKSLNFRTKTFVSGSCLVLTYLEPIMDRLCIRLYGFLSYSRACALIRAV